MHTYTHNNTHRTTYLPIVNGLVVRVKNGEICCKDINTLIIIDYRFKRYVES